MELLQATTVPTLSGTKRERTKSLNSLTLLEQNSPHDQAEPLLSPLGKPFSLPFESVSSYMQRLRQDLESAACSGCVKYSVKAKPDEDGLYLHKRQVRGLPKDNPLAQGGTLLHHTAIYIRVNGKLYGMDYGPDNFDDATTRFSESTPARPMLMNNGEEVTIPPEDTEKLLLIRTPIHAIDSDIVQQALHFVATKKYHVARNNCIQNADFMIRVLTGGIVRSAPFIYDALAGDIPEFEPPILVMLSLYMQRTWFQVCDGGPLTAEFLQSNSLPLPPRAVKLPRSPSTVPSSKPSFDEAWTSVMSLMNLAWIGQASVAPVGSAPEANTDNESSDEGSTQEEETDDEEEEGEEPGADQSVSVPKNQIPTGSSWLTFWDKDVNNKANAAGPVVDTNATERQIVEPEIQASPKSKDFWKSMMALTFNRWSEQSFATPAPSIKAEGANN